MLCETEAEIFSADSRETIFQVTRKYLEQIGATGTELVFTPQLHDRIQGDGTRFQEFTQAIAVLQGNVSKKKPVSERLRDVIRWAETGIKLVAEAAKQLEAEPVADTVKLGEYIASDPQSGAIKSGIALAKALRAAADWRGRLTVCLGYLSEAQDPALLTSLDQAASELLRLKPAADLVFGPDGANVQIVRNCLALAGDAQAAAELREGEMTKQWVEAMAGRPLPRITAAIRQRLRETLAGPKALVDDNPRHEWEAIGRLRSRIAALPALSEDGELRPLLARRTNMIAGHEKLSALLAGEKQLAGKIIIALKLLGEVDNANVKSNLLTLVGHYFESPHLKRDFAGGERAQIPTLFKAVKEALAGAYELPAYRRTRFEEILVNTIGAAASEKRQNDRSLAGPDDVVVIGQAKYKLRNWSPRGLLFGPVTGDLRPGQRLVMTVLIRNAILSINFEVEAEVVRVTGNIAAVQYKFRDRQAERKVKSYFG